MAPIYKLPFLVCLACWPFLNRFHEIEPENDKLRKIGNLPPEVTESSGLEIADENGNLFTHNDKGGNAVLYKITQTGKLLQKIQIPDVRNKDWESLARDEEGNIYIGDTGNNDNSRRDLRIYKVSLSDFIDVEQIDFTYENREAQPGEEIITSLDSEALLWLNGRLFLFTKDRSKEHVTRVYELPDRAGSFRAKYIGERSMKAQVTGADVSPDGKTLALLSDGKLHLFDIHGDISTFLDTEERTIDIGKAGQTEGLVFTSLTTIILSNEAGGLYKLEI